MYPMSKVGYKSKRLDRLIDVLCIFQELRKDTSDEQSIDMEKLKLGIMEKCQIKKKTAEAAIQLSRRRLIDYINLNEVKFKMAISERASVEEVLEFAVIHIERMQEREFQKKS